MRINFLLTSAAFLQCALRLMGKLLQRGSVRGGYDFRRRCLVPVLGSTWAQGTSGDAQRTLHQPADKNAKRVKR